MLRPCQTSLVKGMADRSGDNLNWSFRIQDISWKQQTQQIALAIRDEVLDLESNGIRIIQIDEVALRKASSEKSDWYTEYLDWAIPAFKLVHSGVKPITHEYIRTCVTVSLRI